MPRARGGMRVGASGHVRPKLPKIEGESGDEADNRGELVATTKTFPEYTVKPPMPLTEREKAEVAEYLMVRNRIRKGPLYAVLGDDARISKQRGEPTITDPFDGVETYSQRYTERKRTLPKLDDHPHVLKFFPQELWGTLEPSQYSARGALRWKRKTTRISSKKLDKMVAENSDVPGVRGGQDDEDGEEGEGAEGAENAEEEIDDVYQTDEEDMEGDYNAEAYFDDGGEDAGDDYDAGAGGDDVY